MKKISRKNAIVVGLAVVIVVGGVVLYRGTVSGLQVAKERQDVGVIIEAFGKKLRMVSLAAPSSTVIQSIKDNYGPFIAPILLAGWEEHPEWAPGRATSSPWPDHIQILSVDKQDDGSYDVQGNVVEITSVEQLSGGSADMYQVAMKFRRQADGKWLMTGFTKALAQVQ